MKTHSAFEMEAGEEVIEEFGDGKEEETEDTVGTEERDDMVPLVKLSEPISRKKESPRPFFTYCLALEVTVGIFATLLLVLASWPSRSLGGNSPWIGLSNVTTSSDSGGALDSSHTILQDETPADSPVNMPLEKLDPVLILESYKAQHSEDVLLSEFESGSASNRKFLVGTYGCPDRAGNYLHDLTNGLLFAILTNRTFMWEFDYRESTNDKSQCDELLRASSWIPRFSAWRSRLHLPDRLVLSSRKYNNRYKGEGRFVSLKESASIVNHRVTWPLTTQHLGDHDEFWPGDVILTQDRAYTFASQLFGFEDSDYAKELVPRLYSKGRDFLFGMFLQQTIDFTSTLLDSIQPYVLPDRSLESHQIIGLHSRHHSEKDDGSDVQREMECLDAILEYNREQKGYKETRCILLVMSDRKETLGALAVHGPSRNCSVVCVDHDTPGASNKMNSYIKEHGPFAGAEFFRDWLVVSQAQAGFIHQQRSSSALVYETMMYNNTIDGIVDVPIPRCSTDESDTGITLHPW